MLSRQPRRAVPAALLASALAACGTRSILNPAGPAAESLADLGWFVVLLFLAVTVVMWGLVFYLGYRRRGTLAEHDSPEAEGGLNWILIGGFAIPAAILALVFVLTLRSMSAFPLAHENGSPQIHVLGHRWWFEVQYRIGQPFEYVTTTTEIHIPVGEPMTLALESRDVIHAFWIPQLHGKVDLIPGMVNHIRIQADRPGRYEGQCAEYCGKQHANMRLVVIAEPRDAFEAWLEAQRQPAMESNLPGAARGRRIVERGACALCHTIRGTAALGTVGPDLTHVASRARIAGGMLENNTANLHAWVTHAQSLKPGAQMPDLTQFTGQQLHDIVQYLQTLR